MAAGTDISESNVFPVRYQKAKNVRGYKTVRTASVESSEAVTGQLCKQTVLVPTKSCAQIPLKGECYGRGILEDDTPKPVEQYEDDVNHEVNSSQRTSKIEAEEEADGTSLFDVTDLNDQVEHLKSCIHLCLEEAFYLVHYKKSLKVYINDVNAILTTEDFWKQCCQKMKNFVHKYVVYCYYRDKGWVPKPGAKFGVHFLLYKDGPAYYHSSYGVVVRSIMCTLELSWQFVISLVRAMESVNKGAIICEVTAIKKDVDLSMPSCISDFVVEETMVNRWVPKQDRE